jgi:8-oxo-dGTP pyrophosphatase MutT (NUDIX family)
MTRPSHRRVSRIVLIDEQDRILLLKTASPRLLTPTVKWITPGGGVDEGESHVDGAIRELYEETGLVVESVGEPIYTLSGTATFHDGHVQTTYAEFFSVRTEAFEISRENWLDYEHSEIHDVKWWTLDELRTTPEPYGPANLIEIIESVL